MHPAITTSRPTTTSTLHPTTITSQPTTTSTLHPTSSYRPTTTTEHWALSSAVTRRPTFASRCKWKYHPSIFKRHHILGSHPLLLLSFIPASPISTPWLLTSKTGCVDLKIFPTPLSPICTRQYQLSAGSKCASLGHRLSVDVDQVDRCWHKSSWEEPQASQSQKSSLLQTSIAIRSWRNCNQEIFVAMSSLVISGMTIFSNIPDHTDEPASCKKDGHVKDFFCKWSVTSGSQGTVVENKGETLLDDTSCVPKTGRRHLETGRTPEQTSQSRHR